MPQAHKIYEFINIYLLLVESFLRKIFSLGVGTMKNNTSCNSVLHAIVNLYLFFIAVSFLSVEYF